jgi:hypothetical protein
MQVHRPHPEKWLHLALTEAALLIKHPCRRAANVSRGEDVPQEEI